MKKIILSSLFFPLLFACQHQEADKETVRNIEVHPETINDGIHLSKFAHTSLVPLATSDSVLVGEISRIHNTPTGIYLCDATSVFQFAPDGTFVGRISRQGEGPDDYQSVSDFQVDENGDVWILCRNRQTLGLYSWDNQLKKKWKTDLWMENIYLCGDKMILYTGNATTETENNSLHVMDLASGEVVRHFKPVDKDQSAYLFVMNANPFVSGKSDTLAYFFQTFNDTVYQVTPQASCPKYVFDWGGKNIPRSFYEKPYEHIMDFFQQLHGNGSYAYGISSFMDTESAFWVTFHYQKKHYAALISKKDGSAPIAFNTFSVDGLPSDSRVTLSGTSVFAQGNGTLVIPLNGENTTTSSEWLSEDANPVLLIVKPL